MVDGPAERAIVDLLGRPSVAYLHSRNVLAGCYMFAVHPTSDRAGDLLDDSVSSS